MGRKTVDDLGLKDDKGGLDPVRVAKVRIVTGIPGFAIGVLAPIFIFKKVGIPLSGAPFWISEGVVIATFAFYFLWVVYTAWKEKRELAMPAPEGTIEEDDEEVVSEDEEEDGTEY